MLTKDGLQEVFTYHAPTPDQVEGYTAIRAAALTLAEAIVTHTPTCADQQAALRKVREGVMTANAAIALRGAV